MSNGPETLLPEELKHLLGDFSEPDPDGKLINSGEVDLKARFNRSRRQIERTTDFEILRERQKRRLRKILHEDDGDVSGEGTPIV